MAYTKKIGKGCFVKNSLYFFIGCTLLFLAIGCKTKEKRSLTSQEWYIEHIAYTKNSNVPNVSYYIVRFYQTGNFSLFSGTGFVFGQWRFASDKSFIQLHPNFGDLRLPDLCWKIESQQENKMILGLYPTITHDNNLKDITLQCIGLTNKSSKDPFLLVENSWRKKPSTAETDVQIKSRVFAYLNFLSALYQHTLDNKMDALRYDWFPQPLRMQYGNAVRMAYSGEEMMLWNKCFYDSAQAVKAYLMIGNVMIKQKLKNTDNIAERNLDFVEQIIGHLK